MHTALFNALLTLLTALLAALVKESVSEASVASVGSGGLPATASFALLQALLAYYYRCFTAGTTRLLLPLLYCRHY